MGFVLHTVAGALAATRPEAAAIIQALPKPLLSSRRLPLG
jgi:hypothetical protein